MEMHSRAVIRMRLENDLRRALERKVQSLQADFPGIDITDLGSHFRVTIPATFRVGHEAHFAQVTKQFLRYVRGQDPMPAILLEETDPRSGILIHPGYPPKLYLSSTGCLNPSGPLEPDDEMTFLDSRSRTIALIMGLRKFAPDAFLTGEPTRIDNAWAVIDGEPTG